jgi:hypothetical protein
MLNARRVRLKDRELKHEFLQTFGGKFDLSAHEKNFVPETEQKNTHRRIES